jgi:catechol 2,3-dioxygenase-like lactoylglutathione lyase family enzyme
MGVGALAHVLVLSDDIDSSRDFYCRAIGMTVGERPALPFPGYWLYADGKPCLHIADRAIYTAHARSAGLSEPAGAVDHLAFSATDYAAAADRLERDGIAAIRNSVPEAGLRQLFFDGPDGVRIEVNVIERDAAVARGG